MSDRLGLEADSVVSTTPAVTTRTERTCPSRYLGCLGKLGDKFKWEGLLSSKYQPTHDHADHKAPTTENDVDWHRNLVRKGGIVQDGKHVKEKDLKEIRKYRNLSWPQFRIWCKFHEFR